MKTLNILFLWLLLGAAPLWGQTIEDWYVDTDVSGGDGSGTDWANAYSSVDAAVDAKAGDLVTAQKIVRINIRGSTNADTRQLITSGYTTNSSYYLWLRVDSEDRHAGVWSNSKYRLVVYVNYDGAVAAIPPYTVLEGMQLRNTSTTSTRVLDPGTSGTNLTLRECILRGGSSYCAKLYNGSKAINCLFYGSTAGPGLITQTSSGVHAVNCTAANNGTYGFVAGGYATIAMINCYAGGNSTADYSNGGTGTVNKTNCYSSDGSQSTSQVEFSTNTFVNVTAGSEDLHLVSGSGLIGAGSSSASSYTSIDIDGESRPMGGSWDVGADEFYEQNGFIRSIFGGSVVR